MVTLKSFSKPVFSPVVFDLSDCPVLITKTTLALTAIMGSYLLNAKYIMRKLGDDLFEGDVVKDIETGEEGILYYHRKCYVQFSEIHVEEFNKDRHIKVRDGSETECKTLAKYETVRSSLAFSYRNKTYTIHNFLCKQAESIVMNDGMVIPANDILLYTGWTFEGEMLFFSQSFKGGIIDFVDSAVVVRKGEICTPIENYINLQEELKDEKRISY